MIIRFNNPLRRKDVAFVRRRGGSKKDETVYATQSPAADDVGPSDDSGGVEDFAGDDHPWESRDR